ncbi:MAG TPA: 23S rRNA (pseudouridine(1915)-N(3))-methyltransferase RlmH [Terriglobales bacterium]|nr:23S rRNA (pseudouridine(1915)-N(3))-methyltransferase RlmH [Terriglobales bacterium]
MKIKVAWIGKTKDSAIQSLTDEYLTRIARYADVEGVALANESMLLSLRERRGTRPAHRLILLDSAGKQMTSEEIASFVRHQTENQSQPIVFAIGPADGFSAGARRSAAATLSLGKLTLPHELARVVFLEQLYRAFTILKGHPYHTGH